MSATQAVVVVHPQLKPRQQAQAADAAAQLQQHERSNMAHVDAVLCQVQHAHLVDPVMWCVAAQVSQEHQKRSHTALHMYHCTSLCGHNYAGGGWPSGLQVWLHVWLQ